jgi:hypothetical protein
VLLWSDILILCFLIFMFTPVMAGVILTITLRL